ncbi:sigma-70 family RNA polymerase sigma factor [Corallococcus praedator]|uniref:RNA polymerase sigma factor n=1 Tax=Corallococcus praedator TaxID=2316724 RepID=A0ABX9QLZ3_9BACT|nr:MULTISPECIES: RNA polymerase factor sigma-32 [Corallococcus]RKH18080.1 sigma-70 family RNA polymerase sigma factor [Corallococcus sp. CA047B]RKH34210.1 sigma-70 family RNA polymerase sigma factor [Corallococcus sp. CA031C]RKI12940.1 sigma-70 family RNA polymerase sigma factor [Corallococcus praedator]
MANGRKRTNSPAPKARAKRASAPVRPDAAREESGVEAEEGEALDPDSLEPDLAELNEAEAEIEEPAPRAARVPAKAAALVRAESASALTNRDPLQAYMAEVTRHPLLTREEEHQLAKDYQATGDVRAAYRLVASNLRLVVKLAHEYHRNPLSLLDLVQEGNIGLMQAVKKYDPDRGVKLSSYAAWWIRAYILRYIMDNWKMVKLGTTEAQRKLFFKLRQEQDKLISQGFEASPRLLAERLNVTEQDVVEMDQRLGHDELSIDAPLGNDGDSGGTRADRYLPSTAVPADERLGSEQLKALFRENLNAFAQTLEGKELYIFEHRLTADEPLTLQDIGDKYGVSRERARQIEAALINRMREFMRERIPDFDMVAVPKG